MHIELLLIEEIGFEMNITEFTTLRPNLYHLTDSANLEPILKSGILYSTDTLAYKSFSKTNAKKFLREKRNAHETITVEGIPIKIRDQRPISLTVLGRSLTNQMSTGDFIELLNARVFWWPTLNRLERHFNRYVDESPVIIKVNSADLIQLNTNVEFCRLNSGATRCHPSYKGNAPTRGKNTFLSSDNYNEGNASVAEVTFVKSCQLPKSLWIGKSPNGRWKKIELG